MRISIAVCQNRVCPRFDRAGTLIVIDVRGGREESREFLDISGWPAHGRATRVAQLGVDQLVCGALSSFDEAGFQESPVRLVSRVGGPVDSVIEAILSGRILPGQEYWQDHADFHAGEPGRRRPAQRPEQQGAGHASGNKREPTFKRRKG